MPLNLRQKTEALLIELHMKKKRNMDTFWLTSYRHQWIYKNPIFFYLRPRVAPVMNNIEF